MTDNTPERIWTNGVWVYGEHSGFGGTEYIRADLHNAVCAERDDLRGLSTQLLDMGKREPAMMAQCDAKLEAAEAAIVAALKRLDASLFTNAEHQQAKDILRDALKDKT